MAVVSSRQQRRLWALVGLLAVMVLAGAVEYSLLLARRWSGSNGREKKTEAEPDRAATWETTREEEFLYRDPIQIAVEPEVNRAFVANYASASVSIVDLSGNRVQDELDVPAGPTSDVNNSTVGKLPHVPADQLRGVPKKSMNSVPPGVIVNRTDAPEVWNRIP